MTQPLTSHLTSKRYPPPCMHHANQQGAQEAGHWAFPRQLRHLCCHRLLSRQPCASCTDMQQHTSAGLTSSSDRYPSGGGGGAPCERPCSSASVSASRSAAVSLPLDADCGTSELDARACSGQFSPRGHQLQQRRLQLAILGPANAHHSCRFQTNHCSPRFGR